jgi:hypothetical protein
LRVSNVTEIEMHTTIATLGNILNNSSADVTSLQQLVWQSVVAVVSRENVDNRGDKLLL